MTKFSTFQLWVPISWLAGQLAYIKSYSSQHMGPMATLFRSSCALANLVRSITLDNCADVLPYRWVVNTGAHSFATCGSSETCSPVYPNPELCRPVGRIIRAGAD